MPDSSTDHVLFPREVVVDDAYSQRLAADFARFNALQTGRIALVIVILVVVGAAALLLRLPFWWALPIAGVIGWGIGMAATIRRVRKRVAQVAPPGGRYTIGFGPARLILSTPTSQGETDYRAFEEVLPRGEFTYLKRRSSRIYSLLPSALFTPESLQLLRDRMRV